MAAADTVNKILLIVVSALSGVVLTGAGMVIRGDFLGAHEAQAVEERLKETLATHTSQQNWVNQMILQDLKEIQRKLDSRIAPSSTP
jgi:hypothetical protein